METVDREPRGKKRTAEEAELPLEAPRRIQALEQAVVNKIAAGEIIVAPVNALKEMLENSVDAGAKSIDILVKEGGLKLLQITDDGHGIEKDDLAILCERHTTSKLEKFEDLMSIGTYGFRGEALASISYIAHLKVTTKTMGSSCAWQGQYGSGVLVPPKPGQSAEPRPCAGKQGTQITVEDLFYNAPTRRKAFRSPSEEYSKILDMVTRYAVHCEGVAFSVKKHGEAGAAFTVNASATTSERIRQAHGAAVAKELIQFDAEDTKWGYKAIGYASNANYSVKRTSILLFINHRAVESSTVKKAIEQTYQLFLPKGGHPFVYLSLEIDPSRVDVNVHPTKREVHFLNEDEIVEQVCIGIREALAKVDKSRTFQTQTLLPGIVPMASLTPRDEATKENSSTSRSGNSQTPATQKVHESSLVRTDSKMRKITSMLPPALSASNSVDETLVSSHRSIHYDIIDRDPVQVRLTSIKNLRAEVRDAVHNELTEVFASLTYVGSVDDRRRLAAMQSGVKLYLVDYGLISNEFFYQIGLTEFGNFGGIKLSPPPHLKELLLIASKAEVDFDPECNTLDPEAIAERVYNQLMQRKDMLLEYFSLKISDAGTLETIPLMLKGYLPAMAKLPTFLLRLGPFVNWSDEQECFRTFLTELSSFYVPEQLPPRQSRAAESEDSHVMRRRKEIEYTLEHILFPAFRSRILATKGMLGGVVEVANLKGLYRVFERC